MEMMIGGQANDNVCVDATPVHNATDLTQGGNLAHIELMGQCYTLRITRSGKLILTK